MREQVVDALAAEAVAPIEHGMVVGLGTGRTASRAIRALADRVRTEKLDIDIVSTSEASERLARELGLEVTEFATIEAVDYLFDGADEIDPQLRLMKGGGGAMTRERIVAWATERCVYMVDESKMVERLGQSKPLAIAVLAFGLATVRAYLRELGFHGVVRRELGGDLFITDNGNLILDVELPQDVNLEEMAVKLNDLPGVIDHGLFLDEADEVLVERADGAIDHLIRVDEDEDDEGDED